MSLLIRGMEMPKDCIVCPFGWNGCNHQQVFVYMGERPSGCPLVPVPPHGDLIDRDALMKSESPIGKMMTFGGQYVFTENEIKKAPTIIEAEGEDGSL